MFFPLGESSQVGRLVPLPTPLPKGKAFSPHIVTLSPFPLAGEGVIVAQTPLPEYREPQAPFEVPVEDTSLSDSPFVTKRLPNATVVPVSPERQISQTRRMMDMEKELLKQPEWNASAQKRVFFRNIRNMLSLGIFFLGALLLTGSANMAMETYTDMSSATKNIATSIKNNATSPSSLLNDIHATSEMMSFFLPQLLHK